MAHMAPASRLSELLNRAMHSLGASHRDSVSGKSLRCATEEFALSSFNSWLAPESAITGSFPESDLVEDFVSQFVSTGGASHVFSTVFRSLGASQETRKTG